MRKTILCVLFIIGFILIIIGAEKCGSAGKDGVTKIQKPPSNEKSECDATLVTFSCKDGSLKKVLELLQMQTGNIIELGKFNDRPVSVDFKSIPYWQALDMVAKLSGNTYGADLTIDCGG